MTCIITPNSRRRGSGASLYHQPHELWLFSFKDEEINRIRIIYAGILLLLAVCGGNALARSITAHRAERIVSGWLRTDALSVQANPGRRAKGVQVFTDEAGEPIYYIVRLKPAGFVIVSADDEVEPIIAFADNGDFDPSSDTPLGALVSGDLKGRIATIRAGRHLKTERRRTRALRATERWEELFRLGEASDEGLLPGEPISKASVKSISGVSDLRVAPLLSSKWGQSTVCNEPCFSYYTPGNYRAGCVAITIAQVMRYYQHPTGAVGREGFWIRKDDSDWYAAYARGGDGWGGAYHWADMTLVPGCSITATERRAIGALCYDAAISVNTIFGSSSSQADTLKAKDSLVEMFNYAGAIKAYNDENNIGDGLIAMMNPNLDAKDPVIIGIRGASGHAVVIDGYGYNSSTLYHHLNMGWRGMYDAWYNLPNINSDPSYSTIHKCIYNIHTSHAGGEVVSGRVYRPDGEPVVNPTVYAQPVGGGPNVYAESDENGIYAFDNLSAATTYTIYVSVEGFAFSPRNITTGTSRDEAAVSGNVWGVDFRGRYATDALIGRWKFDETTGSKADDSAGINDGTVSGATTWQSSSGMIDGALQFNGNGYVHIPDESNFDLRDEISVASWVKMNTVDKDWQTVIAKGDSAWRLSTHRSNRKFHFSVTGPPDYMAVNGSVTVPLNEWHHVCGTYDGSNIRLYMDGVEDPASPVAYSGGITTNNFDVYIGENAEKQNRYWRGALDDVRIYNHALRAGQVAGLMCLEPLVGDVNHDCVADMADYAVLTAAYQTKPGDPRWNPDCDISSPADGVIDMFDVNVFLSSWPSGDK